jgi:tRNA (guanine26-N2/guanine27-N2)-dimethyltransferase
MVKQLFKSIYATIIMNILSEGKAKFYASQDKSGKISKELEVFYNPLMKFNRDVSVLLLNSVYGSGDIKSIQIADIMAGSGVRSLRFLLELKKGIIKNITVNDYDTNFTKLFEKNLNLNKIKISEDIILKSEDANKLLLDSVGFDYIDIDPFGSPNDFLETSIVRLSRNGILAVTATDTAPLSGTYPDACLRKYWAKPLRNYLMHEVGLRILIRKIQLIGADHDKALIPIYSYFKDHYNRIFFKCIKGKKAVDEILKMHKYMLYCNHCLRYDVSEFNNYKCECGSLMIYSGPLFTGTLWDKNLAEQIFKANKEENNIKFLETIYQESSLGLGFYDIHNLCKKFKDEIPSFEKLISEIRKKNYVATRTHFTPLGLKTNMPVDELLKLIEKS